MQANLFANAEGQEVFPMPVSFRHKNLTPDNVKVCRFSILTPGRIDDYALQVKSFAKWLERTKTGYWDRTGNNEKGERCTDFIVLHGKSKEVCERANLVSLRYAMGEAEAMMAREKAKFQQKSVKSAKP